MIRHDMSVGLECARDYGYTLPLSMETAELCDVGDSESMFTLTNPLDSTTLIYMVISSGVCRIVSSFIQVSILC